MGTETDQQAPPVAAGSRAEWADVPTELRAWAASTLGTPVTSARTQRGGFSPGVAARLVCADGSRAFVKAVSPDQNPVSPGMHRNEARITAALPAHPSLPTLLGTYDDGYWVAMLYEDVDGRQPALPWRPDELRLVQDTLCSLVDVLDPCPVEEPKDVSADLSGMVDMWQELAVAPPDDLDPWLARHMDRILELASTPLPAGSMLVHLDLRADNLLLTSGGDVVLVDWAQAGTGPRWLDTVLMLMEVELHGGHDVERLVAEHPLTRDVAPVDVTRAVLAAGGMFERQCRQPPPPGLPTIRGFQRAYARATTGWLKRRLDRVWA